MWGRAVNNRGSSGASKRPLDVLEDVLEFIKLIWTYPEGT
jgi:hypothetical protein